MKTKVNNQILNQLVLENCLRFGRDPKLNSRKNNYYIFGSREKLDIFKFYELRYLLLKVYPLIHNLFLQARMQVKKKNKFFFPRNLNFENFAHQLPEPLKQWAAFQQAKKRFNISLRAKNKPRLPQILFATTNPAYSEIVSSAAKMCSMPFHTARWVSGAMTTGSFSQKNQKENWPLPMQTWFQKKTLKQKKSTVSLRMGKPSLIIIPDVSNNEMILRETNILGIPVMGLVNSHCQNSVAYPIFANDNSVYSIHFFCHFLSSLITKEMVKMQPQAKSVSKRTMHIQFPAALKNLSKFSADWAKIPLQAGQENRAESFPGFKGKYFLEQYVKPRLRIRKKARARWNFLKQIEKKKKEKGGEEKFVLKKKKFNLLGQSMKHLVLNKTSSQFKKNLLLGKEKTRLIHLPLANSYTFYPSAPKVKLASRGEFLVYFLHQKTRRALFLEKQKPERKRLQKKMNLILQLRKYSFPQIKREIRLPANLPKFKFWKSAATFYHRKSMQFATNTALGFRFRRFAFRKLNKKAFRQKNRVAQNFRRNFDWKKKRKKQFFNKGVKGFQSKFQSTEYFNRYLVKIGLRTASNSKFEKNISNRMPRKSSLYRKRWSSKKVKKN